MNDIATASRRIDDASSRVETALHPNQPLDASAIRTRAADPRGGATVVFTGVIRNHDGGRDVLSIEYTHWPEQTADALDRVVRSVTAEHPDVLAAIVEHRVGVMGVGDIAVVVAVTCAHRGSAFAAAEAIMNTIKTEVPMWKRQTDAAGESWWSSCAERGHGIEKRRADTDLGAGARREVRA